MQIALVEGAESLAASHCALPMVGHALGTLG
jgi:hypothetical protein